MPEHQPCASRIMCAYEDIKQNKLLRRGFQEEITSAFLDIGLTVLIPEQTVLGLVGGKWKNEDCESKAVSLTVLQ